MSAFISSSPSGPSARRISDSAFVPVAGLVPFSTVDMPGALACVLFTQGCAWRCGYCHNPHLRSFDAEPRVLWPELERFFRSRTGLLDAVVFSGGEPTAHPQLLTSICIVKALGFRIGLHTAGMHPERLAAVLPFCDWVGMDVKSTFERYDELTGRSGSGIRVRESIKHVLSSGVPHEFRTTVHRALLSDDDVLEIAGALRGLGARSYAVQAFRPEGCVSEELAAGSAPPSVALLEKISAFFRNFTAR